MLAQATVDDLNAIFEIELGLIDESSKLTNKWTCPMVETVIGEYLVVPLTSKRMIRSESYIMQNCCMEYIHQCIDGSYCLFSVQTLSGRRIVTLGVEKNSDHWVLDNCLGPRNVAVMERIAEYINEDGEYVSEFLFSDTYFVTHEVLRLINSKPSISNVDI